MKIQNFYTSVLTFKYIDIYTEINLPIILITFLPVLIYHIIMNQKSCTLNYVCLGLK